MHTPTNEAMILARLGYVPEIVPEHWEDVGGPENGPKLVGNPEAEIWVLNYSRGDKISVQHEIVFVGGEMVYEGFVPVFDDVPF